MILDEPGIEHCRWLAGEGPLQDVVISSRIRLARNLRGIPFAQSAPPESLKHVNELVTQLLRSKPILSGLEILKLDDLGTIDRVFLSERHLISHEMVEGGIQRSVGIGEGEETSVMINEEDHLRLQVMRAGLDLASAHRVIDAMDDALEETLDYAYHPRWGYLTACPTNVGTGIRCSVMMHLPGLVLSRQMQRILSGAQEMGLAVRGLQGEGSEVTGGIFQISNQATLGVKEDKTVGLVEEEASKIAGFEVQARQQLREKTAPLIEDKVYRACGILREARIISSKEVTEHLSALRLGVALGMMPDVKYSEINAMLIHSRPAHLQKHLGRTLDTGERDIARAQLLRDWLN